jgi:hypothetical protein
LRMHCCFRNAGGRLHHQSQFSVPLFEDTVYSLTCAGLPGCEVLSKLMFVSC